jgi:hypothetical protein
MDCHTAGDVHGDGTEYVSMKQPGAVSPKCEGCHAKTSPTVSHDVHAGKRDCKACHVRQVVSCTNCHVETLLKTGKRVAVPVSDWVFLMNHEGKVTSANMQTFVAAGDKTFLMFAPQFSHSVTRAGRTCSQERSGRSEPGVRRPPSGTPGAARLPESACWRPESPPAGGRSGAVETSRLWSRRSWEPQVSLPGPPPPCQDVADGPGPTPSPRTGVPHRGVGPARRYSHRSASTGSTLAARHAGTALAARTTRASTMETAR